MAADAQAAKIQGPDSNGNPVPVFVAPPGTGGVAQTLKATFANNAGNAILTASLAAEVGKTNFLAGVYVDVPGATAGSIIDVTVTNTIGGTIHIPYGVATGAAIDGPLKLLTFSPPIPGSAPNTIMTITVPAAGAGNTQQSCGIWGFSQ